MSSNDFGVEIRRLRKLNKLTQKQLAEKIGAGESTVRMWELGKSLPSIENVKRLTEEFKVDQMYLMYLAGYLYETDKVKLETELTKRELENAKDGLLTAANKFYGRDITKDVHFLLTTNEDVYYKDHLLSREEKDKLITIIETVID